MLQVRQICFAYKDKPILNRIDLTIKEEEFLLLTGANGSGKTTLLKILAGLLSAQSGEIFYNGSKISQEELRKITGYVFHNPLEQIFNFTVEQEIAFGLENMGLEREEILSRVDSVMKIFDLQKYRMKDPAKLSAGQAQKVAIASIIAFRPTFLFLDEPTGMLDEEGCRQVKNCLKSLLKNGIGIVVSTHEPWYFEEMTSRVIHLSRGIIDFDGDYDEFKKRNFEDVEILQ